MGDIRWKLSLRSRDIRVSLLPGLSPDVRSVLSGACADYSPDHFRVVRIAAHDNCSIGGVGPATNSLSVNAVTFPENIFSCFL